MRKVVSAVFGVALAVTALSAQTKKAQEDFTFSSDVRVGTQVLTAGNYHFVCDTKGVTISRITVRTEGDSYMTKVAQLAVQEKALPAKSEHSELVMPAGKDGVPQVQAFYIEGSDVEYIISQ